MILYFLSVAEEVNQDQPNTFAKAMLSSNKKQRSRAMQEEMDCGIQVDL